MLFFQAENPFFFPQSDGMAFEMAHKEIPCARNVDDTAIACIDVRRCRSVRVGRLEYVCQLKYAMV